METSTDPNLTSIMTQKNKRKEQENTRSSSRCKRQKKCVEDDLICPITHELPFDPVTALDGQVYEREAIENYFADKAPGRKVKSPMTSQMIDQALLPAPRHRNTIETLIENGVIGGDTAEKWQEKAREKKQVEDLLKQAQRGDINAMEQVALGYDGFGETRGFKKDATKAFHWYQKLHLSGSLIGTAKVGEYLLAGIGVVQNKGKGAYYLGLAVGKGSDLAARIMGSYFAEGDHGLGVDEEEAQTLLEMAVTSDEQDSNIIQQLNDEGKEEAQQELNNLLQRRQQRKR